MADIAMATNHLNQNLGRDHVPQEADREVTREALRNTGQGHDPDRGIETLTGEVDLVAVTDIGDNMKYSQLCQQCRFYQPIIIIYNVSDMKDDFGMDIQS